MKTKTKARAKPHAPATPSTSTALAKITRAANTQIRRIERASAAMQPKLAGEVVPPTIIGDGPMIGALGLVEIKLSEAEEKVLSEPVPEAELLVKPTGQVYLSHPSYTKWYNRAFGRTGWSLVPAAKPMRAGSSVTCPYVMHIHGQPVAFAYGEQEYHENNKEQTFGDALEATVASALRRIAKRLGVGLELWDKAYCDTFIEQRCLKVWIKDDTRPRFRLKGSRPFWNERGQEAGDEQRGRQESSGGTRQSTRPATPPRAEDRPAHYDGKGDQVISEAQRRRLWAIISNSGRSEDEIKAWMQARYNIASSRSIPRKLYEEICEAIEKKGPLPLREPGDDE